MKNQIKLRPLFYGIFKNLFFVFLIACSNEEAEPQYVPSIGAWWLDGTNGTDFTHSITWSYHPDISTCPNPVPCFNEGSFGGIDAYRATTSGTTKSCSVKGSFKNHHIEWSYPNTDINAGCPIKGASYSGTIDGGTITVNSPTLGKLILKQH